MKRVTRDRHLTPDEAAKYGELREAIEAEKSEMSELVRARLSDSKQPDSGRSSPQTLGQRIRSEREARGFSRAEFADKTGVTSAELELLESDRREPLLSTAVRIAHTLEMTLDQFAADVCTR